MLGLGSDDQAALSADDAILVFEHAEDGDVHHAALRAIDAASGATVADLRFEGAGLASHGFSPVAGDTRVAIAHERTGERRPALWDVRTGAGHGPADRPRG